jgi:hypothetical protein
VAPPGSPDVLGATWEFGLVAGRGTTVVVEERPLIVEEDDGLPSERTPLELVWAKATAELAPRAVAVSKAVR